MELKTDLYLKKIDDFNYIKFTIYWLPTINIEKTMNEYVEKYHKIEINADTLFQHIVSKNHNDIVLFRYFCIKLFGMGFEITKQNGY